MKSPTVRVMAAAEEDLAVETVMLALQRILWRDGPGRRHTSTLRRCRE